MNRFEHISTHEAFLTRLQAQRMRVKIWHWFTPLEVQEDGNYLVFSARELASRRGNRNIKQLLNQDREAQLALPGDLQGQYYKSAVGILAVEHSIIPVRLETLNIDGETGFPMVQHALINTREDAQGQIQVKFR